MGSKNIPGKFDCYEAAAPDEPMFVLLGRDPSAGAIVRVWAQLRSGSPEEREKCSEALKCAGALDDWARSLGKAPRVYATVEPHQSPIRAGTGVRLRDFPGPRLGVRRVKALPAPRESELVAEVFYFSEDGVLHEAVFPVEWLVPLSAARAYVCTCDALGSPVEVHAETCAVRS